VTYSSEVQADSPAGYWRLNDSSGATAVATVGSNAAYTGASITYSLTGALTGDSDHGVGIDDPNGYLTVAHATAVDVGQTSFSIEFWCKRAAVGSIEWFHGKGQYATRMNFNASNVFYVVANGVSAAHSSVTVADTNWHHYVVTKGASGTGDDWKIYIDGSDVSVADTSNVPDSTTDAYTFGHDAYSGAGSNGALDEVAIYKGTTLSSTRVLAHYNAGIGLPVWTTPADTVSMSTTPDLKFNSPASASKQHFYMQLDTANTFDTGNLREYDSSSSQTNWTYWDGASWTALPSDGLPIAKAGNEVDYTVTSALSAATWYRRVRAGTLA
jgi:hypothetical protein